MKRKSSVTREAGVSPFCKKLQIYKLWDNFRIMFFSVKASETPVYNLYASVLYANVILIVS